MLTLPCSLQTLRELRRGNGKNWSMTIANTSFLLRKEGKEQANVETIKMEGGPLEKFVPPQCRGMK